MTFPYCRYLRSLLFRQRFLTIQEQPVEISLKALDKKHQEWWLEQLTTPLRYRQ